jgi:hypothetical protein
MTINRTIKLLILIVIVTHYLLFPTLGIAICDGFKGLYLERRELRNKYQKNVIENREKADTYKAQYQAIDQRYRNVIYKMFFEYESKEYKSFDKCCVSRIDDGYFLFVCKLIAYYRTGNGDEFLRNIPVDRNGVGNLWQIDEIIFSDPNYSVNPHPKVFDQAPFSFLFLKAIHQLATKDNAKAINTLLSINLFAEGLYAEFMQDEILSLFENHADIVARNWQVFRKYKSTMFFETTNYQHKSESIIGKYEDLCERINVGSSVCKDIIEFLKEKKKGQ